MKARVLLVVPDRGLARTLRQVLGEVGPAEVVEAESGPGGYDAALALLPHLVVAGVELSGYDGLELCRRLREVPQLAEVPFVALGPRGDQARKYRAFYVGATEYVELPFDRMELMYRLRLQLKGALRTLGEASPMRLGALELEPETRTARAGERRAVLTPSEFALLHRLATQANRPVSTEQLLVEALGQPKGLGNPQLVHTHMRNLRKKLEADPTHPALLLRHPAGYMVATDAAEA